MTYSIWCSALTSSHFCATKIVNQEKKIFNFPLAEMLLLAKGTVSQEDFILKLKLKKFFITGYPKLA